MADERERVERYQWGTDTTYSMGTATVGTYGTANQHKYAITGLTPGTKYYYNVDGLAGSFRTAPAASATSVKFLSYGDTRTNVSSQESVASRVRSAYTADPAYQTILLNSGDVVGGDTEAYWTSEFFVSGTTYPQLHALQSELPIVAARGNHEGTGSVFNKYFPYPYVANNYWSYDYGPVHFVVIDEYASFTSGSAQYNWLVNDLASTTKPWKIVMGHEPGWGAGTHANNTSIQNVIHPVLKQYGVQMYLNGHNHNYARAVVDGIQYLTTGGGGAPLYAPNNTYPNIVKTDQSYHYAEFDVAGSTMTMTARRADGTVIETVSVPQGGGSSNQPPVANAGPDQTVTDSDGNGSETVALNGAGSSDPDGTISSYVWKEGATQIATGATPSVSLAVGTHTLTLTVTDNAGATASDTVVVTVNTAGNQPPGSFSLLSPIDGKSNVSKTPSFDWSDSANAVSYSIVVDNDSSFTSPEISVSGLTSSSHTSSVTLGGVTTYYWKVTATNVNGSTTSTVFNFTTRK